MAADPQEIAAYRSGLMARALRMRLAHAEAEDLVQGVLCRALERRHLYVEDGRLWGWLTTILHHEYVNRVRSSVRRAAVELGAAENVPGVGNPEAEAYAGEVVRTLQGLAQEKRDVLRLITDGWTYEEAAAMLAVPLGTVRSRVSRGRDELRHSTS